MAILKQRLAKRQDDGSFVPVHLETSSDLVLRPDGTTIEDTIVTLTTPRSIRVDLGSTAAASFDGSANVTPGVSGVLPVTNGGTGVSSLPDLKKDLGLSAGGIEVVLTIGLGDDVKWGGYTWIVVQRTGSTVYLALDHIYEMCQFNSNGSTAYSGSNLAARCTAFANTIPAATLNKAQNTTVNGVTAKIFVCSYEQANGGFDYFNSNGNRICKDSNGAARVWWTSSPVGGDVYCVSAGGGSGYGSPTLTCGFRPFVGINC